jgi:RNA polymerase sigma-70 factor (ECF subfamily)
VSSVPPGPAGDVSDEALWQASQAGDGHAFGVLYERHAQKIYNYLFRRLADWSEAEDLTAVVFLEAFRRRNDAVVVEGRLLPWLYGIATNVLRNRRRAQWRHRNLLSQLARERPAEATSDTASRVAAAEQMRSWLERTRELPRDQQDVVALCLLSGLSYEDAARAALAEPNRNSGHKEVDLGLEPERMAEK